MGSVLHACRRDPPTRTSEKRTLIGQHQVLRLARREARRDDAPHQGGGQRRAEADRSRADQRSAVAALEHGPARRADPPGLFFDTPDLALEQGTASSCAPARPRQADDTVVKLRPVVPDEMPPQSAGRPSSASKSTPCPAVRLLRVDEGPQRPRPSRGRSRGRQPLRKLFTKDQRALYEEHAPEGIDARRSLTILGPIFVLKLKCTPPGSGRNLVAELWLYPDGSRILELSTKCAPTEGVPGRRRDARVPRRARIDLSASSRPRRRRSRVLRQEAPGGERGRLERAPRHNRATRRKACREIAIGSTERRRSRTDRAVGYTTAQVLKTCWATGPMPLRRGG